MLNKIREASARRAAGEEGFTLIELLVVVVIMVALAAIAIPIFLNQKTKADESAAQTSVSNIGSAISGGLGTSSLPTITDGVQAAGSTIKTDAGSTPVGGSTIYVSGTDFCVSQTGGGTIYKFTATNPKVVSAAAACTTAAG